MSTVVPYRVRQFQERERAILVVAAELLAEQGYRDTSMDAIAARLGLSKGTLYHHFPSKDDLMAALYEQRLATLLEALREAHTGTPDQRAAIHRALGLLMRSHGEIVRILGDVTSSPIAALRKRPAISTVLKHITDEVSAVIEEGKAAGLISRSLDTPVAVRALYALATYHRYRPLLESGQIDEQALVDALAALYLGGLAAPVLVADTAVPESL